MLTTGDRLVLLHNPRCSKSRAAREILTERGVDFEERRYLETPLSRDELDELARRLGRDPSEWVRRSESAFGDAGLTVDSDGAAILEAMAAHPILMERPILVASKSAVVGRPPESVLELL